MASLQASDIQDLANGTLADLGRFRMVDIASDIREFIAVDRLLAKGKVKVGSGESLKWNLLERGDDNAKNVGLFNRDNTNVKPGTFILEAPWRHTQTSCAFDVREVLMNRSPSKIVDIVKERRQMAAVGLVELMEANFWDGPTDSTDTDTPWGLCKYILGYNASSGFYGSDGNYGSTYGQSAATKTRLKHYTFQYTSVTESDLIDSIRDTLVYTNFKPVVKNSPVPDYVRGSQRVMYTVWPTVRSAEKLARDNNESLGSDLDKYHGEVRIQRVPLVEAPYLTENKSTSCPVIGIDWKQMQCCVLGSNWMSDGKFKPKDGQHNVMEMFTDSSYQFRVLNRRKGVWLGAKSSPVSS